MDNSAYSSSPKKSSFLTRFALASAAKLTEMSDVPRANMNGQGSSFLALPTKRNNQPQSRSSSPLRSASSFGESTRSGSNFDFKQSLLPLIVASCAPPEMRQAVEDELSSVTMQSTDGKVSDCVRDILNGSMVPSDEQWYALHQLRIHAGAAERTEVGIESLMQYFVQLCWLEERFPFESNKVCLHSFIDLTFSWSQASPGKRHFRRKSRSKPTVSTMKKPL